MIRSNRMIANDLLSLELMRSLVAEYENYSRILDKEIRNGASQDYLLNVLNNQRTSVRLTSERYQELREKLNTKIFEGEEND